MQFEIEMGDDSREVGDANANANANAIMMEQRAIMGRLDKLECSVDAIAARAINSLTINVDRLLQSHSHSHSHERLAKGHGKKVEPQAYIIKVARDEDLAEQIGRDADYDVVDHDTVKCFRVEKRPVQNSKVIHFRSLNNSKVDDFCLEMSRLYTYDDVVERVAQQLGLDDPSKIRLTGHNFYFQQPKSQPIKYRGVEHLSDMLVHYNKTSDILYYEVLDMPLPVLQGLKILKVAFHHATKDEVVIHTFMLPKQSTVGDLLELLKTKVELSHPDAELRLLEIFYYKIYKAFPLSETIEDIIDQYWTLRAEEIPEEEKKIGPRDHLIHVYHFTNDTAQNQMQIQNFGDPFFLVIHNWDTLADIKVRIQKKLQVPDDEFAKWKFAFLSVGRPEYLKDSDVVSNRFQRRDAYEAWEQYLGLEHANNAPNRPYTVNQNRHTFEKPVKSQNRWVL